MDCDVDFEETAGAWGSELLADLGGTSATPSAVSNSPAAKTESSPKKNQSRMQLLDDVQLNGDGSERDTRHFMISPEGFCSGFRLFGLAFSEAELLRDGAGKKEKLKNELYALAVFPEPPDMACATHIEKCL